jgi:hypothetical protein
MAYEKSCTTVQRNTKKPNCIEDIGYVYLDIFVPRGTEIATQVLAETLATWRDLINAAKSDRAYPLTKYFITEVAKNEDVFETGNGNQQAYITTNPGKSKYSIKVDSICYSQKVETLNNGSWSSYRVTSTGGIMGLRDTPDGLKFLPIPVFVRVGSLEEGTPTTKWKQPITVYAENPTLFDKRGVVIYPTAFDPMTQLEGIDDVVIAAVSAPTTTTWVVSVKNACDLTPVSGLVKTDFVIDTNTALSDISETSDGVYLMTYSTHATGAITVNLKNQPAMTTKYYEASTTPITGTIPT